VRALVVTSVHRSDDPRIRERTLRSLSVAFQVRYATARPRPFVDGDHEWVELKGGRCRRGWGALRQMLRRDVDVVSVHDPELIPAALAARLLRRVPIVVDVHEDVPAQLRHKDWVPSLLRLPAMGLSRLLLRLAERFCVVTLAEANYRHLFRRDHTVFPNYPAAAQLPDLDRDRGYLVYVGDVSADRGADDMVEAVAAMAAPRPLRLIGRCRPDLVAPLLSRAADLGVSLSITGPVPHRAAMEEVAGASAGLSLLHDLPNYRDSLPTKIVEYLEMGIPVVASDLPGTRVVVEGLSGVALVPPGGPAAAAAALDRVVAGPKVRLATNAQAATLRQQLTWPDREVVTLYLKIAGASEEPGTTPLPS
jgi:glycosyltransferase involved in cell wall biosynthesis